MVEVKLGLVEGAKAEVVVEAMVEVLCKEVIYVLCTYSSVAIT
jgi:hypothetical protein